MSPGLKSGIGVRELISTLSSERRREGSWFMYFLLNSDLPTILASEETAIIIIIFSLHVFRAYLL
jgi:hypothetical protein